MQRNRKPSGKDPRYYKPHFSHNVNPRRRTSRATIPDHLIIDHHFLHFFSTQFWKQFFEASANVSLSNYQEEEVSYVDQTNASRTHGEATYATHDSSDFPGSSPAHYGEHTTRLELADDTTRHLPAGGHEGEDSDDDYLDDSLLDSLNITGAVIQSTPKAQQHQGRNAGQASQWADIESPFETLKKELTRKDYIDHGPSQSSYVDSVHSSPMLPPSTPPSNRYRSNRRLPPGADPETPQSSPFYPPQTTARKTPGGNPNEDALLHRVLDKNWRVQATPLGKQPASRYRTITQPSAASAAVTPKSRMQFEYDDDSPMSPAKPQFHTAHMFDSPVRGPPRPNMGPKTPTTTKQQYGAGQGAKSAASKYDSDDWNEEDSDDLILPRNYSPPVTIQFALLPSKLLATPAREASRRIVKDILRTAGAADESGATDSSPPIVRRRMDDSDDDMF